MAHAVSYLLAAFGRGSVSVGEEVLRREEGGVHVDVLLTQRLGHGNPDGELSLLEETAAATVAAGEVAQG